MNNNNRGNNNNNRRRGRSGNRPQGGAQQLNRIDSRARGNAPQMLEKYRKMAHDAHLNGDRVQEETCLQFADHYFRVIADQRQRQEDQRTPRQPGESWSEGGEGFREDGEDGGEYGTDSEYQPYERQNYNRSDNRPERDDRPRDERPRDERPRDDRPREERPRDERPRDERPRAPRQREERVEEVTAEESAEPPVETASPYEPPENPFVRGSRGLRPRREDRRPRPVRQASGDRDETDDQPHDEASPRGLDPAILPPPISLSRDDSNDQAEASPEADEAPAPRRRTRRPRAAEAGTGEAEGEALKAAS